MSERAVWPRRVAWALAVLLSVFALVQAVHKAQRGECALLKWRPQIDALSRGEMIYGREEGGTREGFPTLPMTALCLRPFLALGDVGGATAWAVFKVALCWFALATAMRIAAGSVKAFPAWACVAVIALCARVLLSDVAHGNINIPIAALVAAAAWDWSRGRELRAGAWIGLGAVLKVTPALFLLYFAWKRSSRAFVAALASMALFAFVAPALFLGWRFNLELASAWWQQMIEPFAAGRALSIVQTEQINQSLLGVLARLATDSVAIRARPPVFANDVSVNVLALSAAQLRIAMLVASTAIVAFVAWCSRAPREVRASAATLGEFALVALAMLFLSERSWKQHYVTLFLPITYLAWIAATRGWRDPLGRLAALALAASALLHGLTGSGLLGDVASDYAEAYGVWLVGGLALFVACGVALRATAPRPARSASDR
jgi:hypothetical protein